MAQIGVAAVGLGQRLQCILDLLLQQAGDRVRIVAVADEAEAVATSAGKKYGCPAFGSIEELLHACGSAFSWVMVRCNNCSLCLTR